jgi:DNA helicase-2/ATP-dependent DNA helicase PcrA
VFEARSSGPAWADSLNASQREAVTCGDGPVLVIAGAGSGKTWTLACRVAHLIERGVAPESILLLTFSRRAAREMLARADRLISGRRATKVWGGTFHAVANRLLRLYGRPLGLAPDFTVLDQADMADLLDLIRGELQLGMARQRERRFPRKDTLVAIYSRMVNAGLGLSTVLESAYPWCAEEVDGVRDVFAVYTRRKRAQNLLDYDDLLLFWRALAESPTGLEVARQFEHVLVDEYQDTNPLQAQILLALRRENHNLMVVGDDAQSIYSFRSASVRNILEFPTQFQGVRRIMLEQNYRSTRPILDVANAVIAEAREGFPKTLYSVRPGGARPRLLTCSDEVEQSRRVCENVLEHREQGTPLREQAVLFRSGHHSDVLELELTRRNIPFVKFGGLKFLEAAHVKDVVAVLRVLENPRDEVSWFRVLQLLDGIGPASARSVLAAIGLGSAVASGTEVAERSPVKRLVESPPPVPEAARVPLAGLRQLLSDCACVEPGLAPAAEIERVRMFVEPIFERRYTSAVARLHDIEQLASIASGYGDRGRFLSELTLDPPTSTSDLAGPPLLDEDYLILSTVHSAKGGEWDVVHVIHAADGMIPSDMSTGDAESIEEERRLFYVALTRARGMLYVYFPLRFYKRPHGRDDAHHYAQLTRFLPGHVQELFDRQHDGPVDVAFPVRLSRSGSAGDVDKLLASLWSR